MSQSTGPRDGRFQRLRRCSPSDDAGSSMDVPLGWPSAQATERPIPDIVDSSNLLAAVDVESPRWKRQRIARSDHATDSPSIADASSLQDTAGNDKGPGVFAPPRAPILNFTHTTCYLGSVLQSLLQTSTVDMFLRQHKAETTCATGCPWCLLRDCRDMIHDPSNQYNPAPWTTFFSNAWIATRKLQIVGVSDFASMTRWKRSLQYSTTQVTKQWDFSRRHLRECNACWGHG